jgi:flagellar protein FliL
MILFILLAQISSDGDSNVALDDERLQDSVPKGLQKVELDLDDALFLEFEEKEDVPASSPVESAPEPEEAPPPSEQPEVQAKPGRKKLWILGIAASLCLILGAGGSYYFMKSGAPLPTEQTSTGPDSPQAEQAGTDSSATPGTPAESTTVQQPEDIEIYSLEQFQIEYSTEDKVRFLTCRFAIPDTTTIMRAELQAKSLIVRDGVYRYLKNSPLSFLDNPQESEKLKADIAAVINQIVQSGQINDILLEEYVVK